MAILLKQKIYCPRWITKGAVFPEKDAITDAKRMRVRTTKYIEVYIYLDHFSVKFFNKMYKKWFYIIWKYYGSHDVCPIGHFQISRFWWILRTFNHFSKLKINIKYLWKILVKKYPCATWKVIKKIDKILL